MKCYVNRVYAHQFKYRIAMEGWLQREQTPETCNNSAKGMKLGRVNEAAVFASMNSNKGRDKQEVVLDVRSEKQFKVICRIRPVQVGEEVTDIEVRQEDNSIALYGLQMKIFKFNRICEEHMSQFQFTSEICEEVLANYRQKGKGCLVLSYGVTNSGKTHTILGNSEEPGILPKLIYCLEKESNGKVLISAVEAYNDQFYSLKNREKLYPKETWGCYEFENYQPEVIRGNNDEQLRLYLKNRVQIETKSNKKSSRSHAIFKIQCGEFTVGVVDLAGSERLDKANCNISQTTSINQNLLCLGKCIKAFQNSEIVPYRQSKLTKALVEYFDPDYKVLLIAHLNRSSSMLYQNFKVLEYAALAKQIKPLNQVVNKSIVRSAKKHAQNNSNRMNSPRLQPSQQCTPISLRSKPVQAHCQSGYLARQEELERRKKEVRQIKKQNAIRLMDAFKNRIVGGQNQFEVKFEQSLRKIEQSDSKFFSSLDKHAYDSPLKYASQNTQATYQFTAEEKRKIRIQLQEQFQEALRLKELQGKVQYGTTIGSSIKKHQKLFSTQSMLQKVLNTPIELLKSSAKKFHDASESIKSYFSGFKSRQQIQKELKVKLSMQIQPFQIFHGVLKRQQQIRKQFDYKQTTQVSTEAKYSSQTNLQSNFADLSGIAHHSMTFNNNYNDAGVSYSFFTEQSLDNQTQSNPKVLTPQQRDTLSILKQAPEEKEKENYTEEGSSEGKQSSKPKERVVEKGKKKSDETYTKSKVSKSSKAKNKSSQRSESNCSKKAKSKPKMHRAVIFGISPIKTRAGRARSKR